MRTIDAAFADIPRQKFLPIQVVEMADLDLALPIGYQQTNSQPATVRLMLGWLDVTPGNKILDVGSGSGWTTALLAYLTSQTGKVIAVERIPELVAFGKANCQKFGLTNVTFYQAGHVLGWPELAPYDRILVSAAASEMPNQLIDQLAAPGRLVVPVKNSIFVITKDKSGQLEQREYPGFMFVPLTIV